MSQPYEVRVTKQAQDQMSEIFDYICEELWDCFKFCVNSKKLKFTGTP